MIDSVEMDEVGTQGQGGRQNQDQEREIPRRDDQQDQERDKRSKQDQPGRSKREGQRQEDEEEN